ncbi:hypothetical protein SAMN05444401_0076 [Clostridium amylolyticum]|uniref:Uncharacterized protein n=1 Tax=Clostridium amylolyticum TaxID=1121298 RepID=A0A1M6N3V3_9CLOT|nr:hypothetical protein SAMN05444401_0076 [Clostridium amylolyticum]
MYFEKRMSKATVLSLRVEYRNRIIEKSIKGYAKWMFSMVLIYSIYSIIIENICNMTKISI